MRAHLWDDLGPLRALCEDVLPCCALAKLSAEEAEACTGSGIRRAADRLAAMRLSPCVALGAVAGLPRADDIPA